MFFTFIHIKLQFLSYFRASVVLDLFSGISFILVNVVFWETIYSDLDDLNGISKSSVYFYLMYIEFFFMIYMLCFSGFSKMWRTIIDGRIDRLLVMPVNPVKLMILDGINLPALIKLIPIFFLGAYATFINGSLPSIVMLGIGFLFVILTVVIYGLIQFSASCLAFWIGRSSLVDEVSDQLSSINSVPHSVLSNSLKYGVALFLPFAALPTDIVLFFDGASRWPVVWSIAITLLSLGLWICISSIAWSRGRKIYTSFGG